MASRAAPAISPTSLAAVKGPNPRLGFKREFAGLYEPRPGKSLVAAPGTCTASP